MSCPLRPSVVTSANVVTLSPFAHLIIKLPPLVPKRQAEKLILVGVKVSPFLGITVNVTSSEPSVAAVLCCSPGLI